jgi:glycosyltransferase involved in cell wall biosynthesis
MKPTKPTVTIGIPAYNEAANIERLLRALLDQKQTTYILKQIIVASDGSTDDTVRIVKNIKAPQVTLIKGRQRCGQAYRQNEIADKSQSDVLVLINADVLPVKRQLVERLIAPIIKKQADLTSGERVPLPSRTLVERILIFSTHVKYELFKEKNYVKNVYFCNGALRAFSKRLYKSIHWPNVVGEDAYSYFFCLQKGFTFLYQPAAQIYYRCPDNFAEHSKQSIRFLHSQQEMARLFGSDWTKQEYAIPQNLVVDIVGRYFFQNPVSLVLYMGFFIYAKIYSLLDHKKENLWDMATTSKKLI